MGLGGQIIDLVRLDLLHNMNQAGGIGEIAMVQDKLSLPFMRSLIEMIDPGGVEQGRTALDSMHLIALLQQKFSQIGSILTGNAGDQGLLSHGFSPYID